MAKRKLTQRQQQRIRDNQAKRRESGTSEVDLSGFCQPISGLVVGHYGHDVEVEPLSGDSTTVMRCKKRSNLPMLITGDVVTWCYNDNNEGIILACDERHSVLERPDMRGKLKPVAANIEQVFIVICSSPATPANLIDRYLVAAHISKLTPILVLNKCDLLTDDDPYYNLLKQYQELGYQTLTYSAEQQQGLEQLEERLKGSKSIFVGQSGVGKSSMLQTLLPELEIRVGAISDATGKGKHTTTNANLFHLPFGGDIIDSPGIREFGLWHVDKTQVIDCFPEFSEQSQHCKFRNCQHEHEPGCAVKALLEQDPSHLRRFESMKTIEESVDEFDVRTN